MQCEFECEFQTFSDRSNTIRNAYKAYYIFNQVLLLLANNFRYTLGNQWNAHLFSVGWEEMVFVKALFVSCVCIFMCMD